MNAAELYDKQLDIYARRVYPIYLNALKKQVAPVVEFIRRTGNIKPPLDILVMPNVFIRPIQQSYEQVATIAAKREYYAIKGLDQLKILGLIIDAWRAIFLDYATKYAYRIDNDLTETTKNEIRTALAESYDQGLNADRTATYIRRKVGGQVSRSRAVTISRTESATAANLGKRTGADTWLKETGQKGFKQWIGRDDGKEREDHVFLNDTVVPIEDDFNVGGEGAQAPGDIRLSGAERINCRCTVIYMSERRYNRMFDNKSLLLEDLVI